MNVADTKPYNADFDGDEMNMHVPQDAEAEVELKDLVAVPHVLLSWTEFHYCEDFPGLLWVSIGLRDRTLSLQSSKLWIC